MKFWLIQRGRWNPYNKTQEEIKSLTGEEGLIDLDYMGSSEFEWGAIPKAYRRIMAQFEDYILIKTDLTNINGVPMYLFCKHDQQEEIIEAILAFVKKPYQLQEWSDLDKEFNKSERFENGTVFLPLTSNFWWEVENGKDFMCFFGAKDREDLFRYVINGDYNNWWMMKPKEDREKDVKESFNNRW